MVGAPYQTVENLADDLLFIKELDPQMVGIGPFVPHHDTRFKEFPSGSVELTTYLVSILRLMNPHLCFLPQQHLVRSILVEEKKEFLQVQMLLCRIFLLLQ